jgi:cytochrome c peroxidase
MFWDGRASGWTDGVPLVEQAKGPFLNPVEMHNQNQAKVVKDVRSSEYADLFEKVYGSGALANVGEAYHKVADAIAVFESSRRVNTFSSRFDAYEAGDVTALTEQELRGRGLYDGQGQCSQCHPSTPGVYSTGRAEGKALFTDFTYDNLGIPHNPVFDQRPLSFAFVPDVGLGGFLRGAGYAEAEAAAVDGAFKVPTLRNIGKTAPYGHNGYFATLEEIVRFYHTAGIPGMWPAPEVPQNVNREELGELGLSAQDEADIVAFLRTLDDRVEFDPSGL